MANDDIAMKRFVSNDEGTFSLFEWDSLRTGGE